GIYLTVAVADPFDFETMDSLPHVLGREVNFVCAPHSAVQLFLKQFYGAEEAAAAMDVTGGHDVEGSDSDAPIIKLVQSLLSEAMKMRCSDIHLEPLETSVRVRYRIDGKL